MTNASERLTLSGRTARARRKLSAPGEYLLARGLLAGRVLDFGCGHGDLAKFIAAKETQTSPWPSSIEQWDPNFHDKKPRGKFDTVACIYVLNVLPPRCRKKVLQEAQAYVKKRGRLYVAVRRDLSGEGKTSIGTEQYNVHLRKPFESIYRRSKSFEIYEWTNV